MTNISENLEKILQARYGEEVRSAIHDSIRQCAEVNGVYVGPSNKFIDSVEDAESAGFTDADTKFGEFNKLYIITRGAGIKNLPTNRTLFFITLSWDTNVTAGDPNDHVGILQIAFSDPGSAYTNIDNGSGQSIMYMRTHAVRTSGTNIKSWSEWTQVSSNANGVVASSEYGVPVDCADFNDIPSLLNKMVFIPSGTHLENGPDFLTYNDSIYRTVITFTPFKLDDYRSEIDIHGIVQIVISSYKSSSYENRIPCMFCRYEVGSGSDSYWSDWFEIGNQFSTLYIPQRMYGPDYFEENGITSANQLPSNQVYFLGDMNNLDDLPEGLSSRYAMMLSFTYNRVYDLDKLPSNRAAGTLQLLATNVISNGSKKMQMFSRLATGNEQEYGWSEWYEITKQSESKSKSLNIFKKVVCCGDSYTAGYVEIDSATYKKNEDYAWPYYLSKLTGQTYINAGSSGANVSTWQNDTTGSNRHKEGYERAVEAGVSQAYIIGLGINDSNSNYPHHIDLGSKSDMGTGANTYYGQYVELIKKLHAISPKAIFFMQTNPQLGEVVLSYNQAVKDIVDYAKTTLGYRAHLIDLDPNIYKNDEILSKDALAGHYTAIGYNRFAELLYEKMSTYINDNISQFQDVFLLPTE